ncbi:MAG: serine/threonine protein kinase, partial [Arenimonas sp.]
ITAHSHGVVHRDIKPANMILSQRGQIKIADFGIALANHDMHNKLTSQGEFVGTPGYLAPEALLGKQVDQRSDVYALGVVLFEMLTGRTPFSNSGVYQLMLDSVQSEVPDVREFNADIDSDIAEMLHKMLHKNAADRYQSMTELLADLEKSPLLTRGPIKLKAAAPVSGDATLPGSAIPVTPGATPQVRHQVKVSSLPNSSPSNREPAKKPEAAPPASEPHKFVEEILVTPEPAAKPKSKSKSPNRKYLVAVLFLLIVATLWLYNSTGNTGGDLVASTSRSGGEQMSHATFAIFDIYATAKSNGVQLINPLLERINLPLPAGLLFDVIMLLLGAALLKNIASAIFRKRPKKHSDR